MCETVLNLFIFLRVFSASLMVACADLAFSRTDKGPCCFSRFPRLEILTDSCMRGPFLQMWQDLSHQWNREFAKAYPAYKVAKIDM